MEVARVWRRARARRKWVRVYTWSRRGARGSYNCRVSEPSCRKVTNAA